MHQRAKAVGVVGAEFAAKKGPIGRVNDKAGLSSKAMLRREFWAVALLPVHFDEGQAVAVFGFEFRPDRAETIAGRSPFRVNEVDGGEFFRMWDSRSRRR